MIALTSLSFVYELYRATIMAGVSVHDSLESALLLTPLYAGGIALAVLSDRGRWWATWSVLGFTTICLAISLFHYNRIVMPARDPGLVDWFEDIAFTAMVALVLVRSLGLLRRRRRLGLARRALHHDQVAA